MGMLHMDSLTQSFIDLTQDFEELSFLFLSQKSYLEAFEKSLIKQKRHISLDAFDETLILTKEFLSKNRQSILAIKQILKQVKTSEKNETELLHFIQSKKQLKDICRTNAGLISSLIVSTDWQSPSYNYSLYSQAGRQTGKIFGTLNDYKRDQHLDEESYQNHFVSKGYQSYLVNSGMAAFTTIMYFLASNKKIKSEIMLGTSCYFEIKDVVKKTQNKVFEFDEMDIEALLSGVKRKKPSVIIIDLLTNTEKIIMPNIQHMMTGLAKVITDPTYIIIDNSCLGPLFNIRDIETNNKNINCIIFESLNKYYQFGLDRVTAGIIYVKAKEMEDLFFAREHSGTNITDSSVYVLPPPNKKNLLKRVERFGRNASVLVSLLQEYIDTHDTKVESINYPDKGGFFTFTFKKENRNSNFFKKFIRKAISTAKKNNINLIAGTSFGLDTSRIYLTALNNAYGEPFVRFSVGTESMWEVEKIGMVLEKAIESL
jgi:cystathionine beta-lyase/cystathionine gamma-synthase